MSQAEDEYWLRIVEDIKSQPAENLKEDGDVATAQFWEETFVGWAAALLAEEGVIDAYEEARWEFRPPSRATVMKVNGYSFDPEARTDLALLVACCDTKNASGYLGKAEIEAHLRAATLFAQSALNGSLPDKLEPSQPHAALASLLYKSRTDLSRLRVLLLTDQRVRDYQADDVFLEGLRVSTDIWDRDKLTRLYIGGIESRSDLVIDLEEAFGGALPCVPARTDDARYQAFLAAIPGPTLEAIYERYGPRLLEANVRSFLQAKGKVNKGIRETLQKDPGGFFAYNNGLSAVADSVETGVRGEHLCLLKIHGLQIVNGAQTTGSIHRAHKKDGVDLENVVVPMKLTCVQPGFQADLIPRISLYANSQNTVKIDDFSANAGFHVRLEELSRRIHVPPHHDHRWFYERARGQYQDEKARCQTRAQLREFNDKAPAKKKLTKTDVARYIHAWEGKPHVVGLGSQKNFSKFTHDWLEKRGDWLPDDAWYRDLIAKAVIYRSVEKIARGCDVPAYRANVVAYAVASLANLGELHVDLEAVWKKQGLSAELQELIAGWCPILHKELTRLAGGRNVTEWCKKEECWSAIGHIKLPGSTAGIPEMRRRDESGTPADIVGIDILGDRAALLKLAREVVRGRILKERQALDELKERLGIGRLSNEKRQELESALADVSRMAFIDDELTRRENEALAVVRGALRSGVREREELLREIAQKLLQKVKLGARVREEAESFLPVASRRRVLTVEGEAVSCPTPTFDDYEDDWLDERIAAIMTHAGRIYTRADVVEAVIHSLGFQHARGTMQTRVDDLLDLRVQDGSFAVPSEGCIVKPTQ